MIHSSLFKTLLTTNHRSHIHNNKTQYDQTYISFAGYKFDICDSQNHKIMEAIEELGEYHMILKKICLY